jgi:ribosomal protein S7
MKIAKPVKHKDVFFDSFIFFKLNRNLMKQGQLQKGEKNTFLILKALKKKRFTGRIFLDFIDLVRPPLHQLSIKLRGAPVVLSFPLNQLQQYYKALRNYVKCSLKYKDKRFLNKLLNEFFETIFNEQSYLILNNKEILNNVIVNRAFTHYR